MSTIASKPVTWNATLAWVTRCIPAFSVFFVFYLLIQAVLLDPYVRRLGDRHDGRATLAQSMLSIYTILLHIISIFFPARVYYSLGDVVKRMKERASWKDDDSLHKSHTIQTPGGPATFPSPLFVIIVPAYNEEVATLQETLKVLASHPRATQSYHVYLALEAKEANVHSKGAEMVKQFRQSFYDMTCTIHPYGIPGEAQGKSSNESWAAKQASKHYSHDVVKKDVIITVMDADTHLSQRYFEQIARAHVDNPVTNQTTMYVPPTVFDRNLHRISLPVRTSDLLWASAGISCLVPGAPVSIPTSVYSLPMTLVEHVGGWDADPCSIGEDMHMYLKCFFALSGNLNVQIVYAAASQCNVSSNLPGFRGYVDGWYARYRQAVRHMWGSLDSGYAVRKTIDMYARHKHVEQLRANLPLSAGNANWTAFYTSTGLHKSLFPELTDETPMPPTPINTWNVIVLFQRLFEAHFVPIHLAVITLTSTAVSWLYPTALLPEVLHMALDFSGWCRLAGWLLMIRFYRRFNEYHHLCVGLRYDEMRKAGLLDEMMERDSFTADIFHCLGVTEAALFPLGGIIFGALPAMQATFSHLFTDKLTYVVSIKPQSALKRLRGMAPINSQSEALRKQAFFARLDHVTTPLVGPVGDRDE